MRIAQYLIFLIFNNYYKNGNYKEADIPYFSTTGVIMLYEFFILIVGMHFIGKHVDISFITSYLSPLNNVVYGRGMVTCALMYPANHYYFIKKNKLDQIYDEFKNARINTKKK